MRALPVLAICRCRSLAHDAGVAAVPVWRRLAAMSRLLGPTAMKLSEIRCFIVVSPRASSEEPAELPSRREDCNRSGYTTQVKKYPTRLLF